jgi:NO-binding membrane sensor protein with MHYT domain
MRLMLALATTAVLLAVAVNAAAADRWKTGGAVVQPGVNKYHVNAAKARKVYPQYYWGFHARQFQNIGVPSGDIGMGGANGFTRNPW